MVEQHRAGAPIGLQADCVVELGPSACYDGERIAFEGTPAELVAARCTPMGEHPVAYVEG